MLTQVAGVSFNRFLKQNYTREYTESMCASNVGVRIFNDAECFACVVRTLKSVSKNREISMGCFHKAALLSGYNDIKQHFTPA